jgi:hypothetical protein
MQQDSLKRLSSDFAGSDQVRSGLFQGGVFRCDFGIRLLLITMIKGKSDKAFGFNVGRVGDSEFYFHNGFLSTPNKVSIKNWILILARPRYGFAGFFISSTAAFGFALVPCLFAFGQRDLNFDFAIFEIHARGDQCETFLLAFAQQPA